LGFSAFSGRSAYEVSQMLGFQRFFAFFNFIWLIVV